MYWHNGRLLDSTEIALPTEDPGLLFGATVFSTIRVQSGQSVAWEAHRDRLYQSVTALGWQLPDWDRVERGLREIAARYPVVRVTLFPDGREWILGRSLPKELAAWREHGVRAVVMPGLARSLPEHKTGNYLACWQARTRARQVGAQEAILTDTLGVWLETSSGNLWGWRSGCWLTPPLAAGILPGIARAQLWAALVANGEDVAELTWDRELVASLEAIAYCNCVVGLLPLREICWPAGETRLLPGSSPALRRLQALLPA